MEIKETVQKLLQEMVVPDLSKIRDENSKILAILEVTNKRLDDVNTHLTDQSRRIDDVRSELGQRIDEVRSELGQRIDETNKRIDEVRSELGQRIDEIHSDLINRIDQINMRIDEISAKLSSSIDGNNARIDRFFETTVTKYEHGKMDERVARLEREMAVLRRQVAA